MARKKAKTKDNVQPLRPVVPPVRTTRSSRDGASKGPKPWEQMKGETDKAYQAFTVYLHIPTSERTLSEAYRRHYALVNGNARKAPRSPNTWFRQIKIKHSWESRASAYDRFNFAFAHEAAVEQLFKEYYAQNQIGKMLYTKATNVLQKKAPGWWKKLRPKELLETAKLGAQLAVVSAEKMVDLSVARIDAEAPVLEFDPGSAQEEIFDAIMRGDWNYAQKRIERYVDSLADRERRKLGASSDLTVLQQERVRKFLALLGKPVIGPAGEEGAADGKGPGEDVNLDELYHQYYTQDPDLPTKDEAINGQEYQADARPYEEHELETIRFVAPPVQDIPEYEDEPTKAIDKSDLEGRVQFTIEFDQDEPID